MVGGKEGERREVEEEESPGKVPKHVELDVEKFCFSSETSKVGELIVHLRTIYAKNTDGRQGSRPPST